MKILLIILDMDFTGVNHLDYPNADLTNKFFGYLVASQMNTVESISRIETDVNKMLFIF